MSGRFAPARRLLVQLSAAAFCAAAAYATHAAPGPAVAPGRPADAAAASVARCDHGKGAPAKPCDGEAVSATRARGDEAQVYADARSTRLRNRAYLRAAAVYCERYSARVRAACVDEAAAIYRP